MSHTRLSCIIKTVLSGPEPEGHACNLPGLPNISSVVAQCGAYGNRRALAIAGIDRLAGHAYIDILQTNVYIYLHIYVSLDV